MEKKIVRATPGGRLRRRLAMLGLPPHMIGYEYVISAVERWRPGVMITKELYPEVAKVYGTSFSAVEKCIRYAIKYAWDKGRYNTGVVVEQFGVWALVTPPCASEMISSLARWINED